MSSEIEELLNELIYESWYYGVICFDEHEARRNDNVIIAKNEIINKFQSLLHQIEALKQEGDEDESRASESV